MPHTGSRVSIRIAWYPSTAATIIPRPFPPPSRGRARECSSVIVSAREASDAEACARSGGPSPFSRSAHPAVSSPDEGARTPERGDDPRDRAGPCGRLQCSRSRDRTRPVALDPLPNADRTGHLVRIETSGRLRFCHQRGELDPRQPSGDRTIRTRHYSLLERRGSPRLLPAHRVIGVVRPARGRT